MVSGWKWDPLDVAANEYIGLCVVDQNEADNASCWLIQRADEGNEYDNKYSFLLDPTLLTDELRLEDYIDHDSDVTSTLY